MAGQRFQHGRIRSGLIGRLDGPEKYRHGPLGLDFLVAKPAVLPGMGQRIPDTGLPLFDQRGIPEGIAQAQEPVGIISRLLIAPPVLAMFPLAGNLPGPEAGIIGIGHGLGMAGQAAALTLQHRPEPALGAGPRQFALGPGLGMHGGDGQKAQQT